MLSSLIVSSTRMRLLSLCAIGSHAHYLRKGKTSEHNPPTLSTCWRSSDSISISVWLVYRIDAALCYSSPVALNLPISLLFPPAWRPSLAVVVASPFENLPTTTTARDGRHAGGTPPLHLLQDIIEIYYRLDPITMQMSLARSFLPWKKLSHLKENRSPYRVEH